MKRILLGIILVGLVVSLGYCQEPEEQPLKLTIQTDKQTYTVGDEVIIHCKVKNISDRVVGLYKNLLGIGVTFQLSYGDGKLCITTGMPCMLQERETEFVSLSPKESLDYTITGNIYQEHQHLLFDYNCIRVYLLNGFDKYYMKAFYSYSFPEYGILDQEKWLEESKDIRKKNPTSNTITIEVVEKK